jgi:hypothetical protein
VLIGGEADSGAAGAETAFIAAMLEAGYSVVRAASREGGGGDRAAVAGGDLARLAEVGRRHGAEIVVVGALDSESTPAVGKFHTGRGALQVRVYLASTGEVLSSDTASVGAETRGVMRSSAMTARQAAAEACGRQAAAAVLERLRALGAR